MQPPSRNHGMKSSRLDRASQNCLKIGQRVWGHVSFRRPSTGKSRFGRDSGRPWPASACCQSVCFTDVCRVGPSLFAGTIKGHWPARAVQPSVSPAKHLNRCARYTAKKTCLNYKKVMLASVIVHVVCMCRCVQEAWKNTSAPPTRCDACVQVWPKFQGNPETRCENMCLFVVG